MRGIAAAKLPSGLARYKCLEGTAVHVFRPHTAGSCMDSGMIDALAEEIVYARNVCFVRVTTDGEIVGVQSDRDTR